MEYFHIFSSGLIVTLSTVFVFFLKKYLEFKDSQISKAVPIDKFGKYDLSGKVIILTGATDGIGKEMARLLSSFNPKRLIIPARNKQKGINLLNYIKNKNGSSDNVEIWDIDLADLQSVVDFADKFIREVGELHMLFNNAGLFNLDNIRTKDNLESHLQVNHLAPFLLTIKLLDTLKKSATPDSPSKISFTSSNIMISNEIAHRYQNSNITSSSAHPGLINTQMIKSNDSLIGKIIIKFVKYHTESWEQGAVNMLYPVLSSNINDNGNYFDKCVEREPNKITLDEEMREILWDFSVDLLTEKGYFQK
ncbi:hypothetical protein RclHR1_00250045 [Rhizophagus clarus]|uniref:NAD(P)-binding protein n=1 Tax=Rhizophagus clarus TaxID=94130 RepID=A0A2Z6QYK1_9GLOM|nr:hypothetical protein RclHR1_00250045 [Rhizophagus clarus]